MKYECTLYKWYSNMYLARHGRNHDEFCSISTMHLHAITCFLYWRTCCTFIIEIQPKLMIEVYHGTFCSTDCAAGWNIHSIPATWKEAARRANNLSQGFTANSQIWSRPQRTHALASVDFKHLEMGGKWHDHVHELSFAGYVLIGTFNESDWIGAVKKRKDKVNQEWCV